MITLVIVHWNTPKELKKQLSMLAGDSEFHIIVVDNHSDEPVSWIASEFPKVQLIQNKVNRG